ncbi:MAG: thiol-disulfide oxidoreductase DCC family protein [Planctomycetota bacterium]
MANYRVYMDAHCPVCQRSRRSLARLDWLNKLEFFDVHNRERCKLDLPKVSYAEMLTRMYVKLPDGRYFNGFRGFRALANVIPVLWLFWPVLWLPGASWFGGKFYDFIARNRFRFSDCSDELCTLHMHLVSGKKLDDTTIQKVIELHRHSNAH